MPVTPSRKGQEDDGTSPLHKKQSRKDPESPTRTLEQSESARTLRLADTGPLFYLSGSTRITPQLVPGISGGASDRPPSIRFSRTFGVGVGEEGRTLTRLRHKASRVFRRGGSPQRPSVLPGAGRLLCLHNHRKH